MLATFAFDVCHDVYRAAREVIDSRIPTLNMESSGKHTWRPDRMPRLAEYVADFARAGERALGDAGQTFVSVRRDASLARSASSVRFDSTNGRPGLRAPLGARARRHLGISELTWADWAEEIRTRVGKELASTGVFPPSKYFQTSSIPAPENAA